MPDTVVQLHYNAYYYRRHKGWLQEELEDELHRMKQLLKFHIPQFNDLIITRWRHQQIRAIIHELRLIQKRIRHHVN